MLVSNNGLSIPALEMRIGWSRFLGANGTVNHALLEAACRTLADAVVGSKLSYYDSFARGTISSDGLEVVVSEPITLDTVFVSPADGTRYPIATTLFKAPAGKLSRQAEVDGFNKTWFETVAHRFAALCVQRAICIKLGTSKNGRIYQRRAEQIQAQMDGLVARLSMAYLPTAIYCRNGDGLLVSTPGFVWGDSVARATFDHDLVANSSLTILLSTVPAEAKEQVSEVVLPKLKEIAKSLSFAVNVDKATSRVLTDQEASDFMSLAGSLVAMPLLAIDAMGPSNRSFDMDAVVTQLTRIAAILKGNEDVATNIDLDATPRSLAELMTLVTGTVDFKFVDSVDAFYRRKELPILPAEMSAQLASTVLSVHPALIAGATVVGPRTVRYVDGTKTYDVEFPDRLGSGYTFSVAGGNVQATAMLHQINSFLQLTYAVLTGSDSISPLVLRQMGIRGVQKGASFALNAA